MKKTLEEQLQLAIEIATKGHKGQVDKGGKDYIFHPLQVMSLVENLKEKIVAVLHDVPEDTIYTLDDLRSFGFDEDIVEAVNAMTKREDETYFQFIYRVSLNPLAINPKIKDMTVNSDLSRIEKPTAWDYERTKRYARGIDILSRLEEWAFNGEKWVKVK